MRPYRSSSNNAPFFFSRTGTWQCALYNRSFFFHQNIFFREKGALPCAPTHHPITHPFLYYSLIFTKQPHFQHNLKKLFFNFLQNNLLAKSPQLLHLFSFFTFLLNLFQTITALTNYLILKSNNLFYFIHKIISMFVLKKKRKYSFN